MAVPGDFGSGPANGSAQRFLSETNGAGYKIAATVQHSAPTVQPTMATSPRLTNVAIPWIDLPHPIKGEAFPAPMEEY